MSGLRERKKARLRRDIQVAAVRLFEARGYENTTVEQIAEAAETSTTTFYRYFPVKEDVMLANDASPLFEAVIAGRPDGEPLAATIRAAMAAVVAAAEADRDLTLARMRLIAAVPALEARVAGRERATVSVLAALLARRAGRPADDFQVELVAFVLSGVVFTASRRWVASGGATSLAALVDQALTTVGPLLDALGPAGPLLLFRQGNSPIPALVPQAGGGRASAPAALGRHERETAMDAQFWDDRYSEQEQLFSGNANGVLVVEVSDLKPGRVLDVGAGEGGDAIWLAERGWTVAATDISAVALARAERAAQARGLAGRISWEQADLAAAPPATAAYDLVTASYIPVPVQEGHAALRGLLNAVAPGGTLLFVGHSRAELPPGHDHAGYDPDDYYWPEDIAKLLGEDKQLSEDWIVVASETRERVVPPPPGTHHVHDTVLRAERRR